MVSFEVIVSPHALQQLNSYVDYLQYTLLNFDAAEKVWQDAMDTTVKLENVAGSLLPCKHPKLKKLGYHPMLFLRHDYVMLYRIEDQQAIVEAIYHQLEDYENKFAGNLGL